MGLGKTWARSGQKQRETWVPGHRHLCIYVNVELQEMLTNGNSDLKSYKNKHLKKNNQLHHKERHRLTEK